MNYNTVIYSASIYLPNGTLLHNMFLTSSYWLRDDSISTNIQESMYNLGKMGPVTSCSYPTMLSH